MKLDLSSRDIARLAFTKDQVEITFADGVQEVTKISREIKVLDCSRNQIKTLKELPQGIEKLNCSCNQLEVLENLPQSLKKIYCSDNKLKKLEILPREIKEFFCSNNQITKLEGLPKSLVKFDCKNNPLIFVEPIRKRPSYYSVPDNLVFLHSEDNYDNYYKDYVVFKKNFYALKTLLLFEIGYPILEVLDNITFYNYKK
jgi:Leucine-rich repeat (LRR) protein